MIKVLVGQFICRGVCDSIGFWGEPVEFFSAGSRNLANNIC